MNTENIIKMAQEAGLHSVELLDLYGGNVKDSELDKLRRLERFAHLVYESVFRDANIAASRTILDAAVLEEREACAKVCSEFESEADPDAGFVLAAAIRARSNP